MDFPTILKKTDLPNISVSDKLDKRVANLAAVLAESDIEASTTLLPFLKNEVALNELKKAGHIVAYGGQGDLFDRVLVVLRKAKESQKLNWEGTELSRKLLHAHQILNPTVYFGQSVSADDAATFLNGFLLGNYKWTRKTDQKSQDFKRYTDVTVIHKDLKLEGAGKFPVDLSKYTLMAREFGNPRPDTANPETMLSCCKQIAQHYNLEIETVVDKELPAKNLNLIWAVGRAASHRPCLVVLKYKGNPNSDETLGIVGKGVCFDAGGLNLKVVPGAIEDMFADKGGSCATLAGFIGIVDQKLPINVVLGIAYVENLLGDDAYHPSDIITSYKGLTVEIGNTDAEGRLCMADTYSYLQKNYKIQRLIEMSTLTGAAMVGLGYHRGGLWSNDEELAASLLAASGKSQEILWRMPLDDEDRENTKSKFADLSNAVPLKYGASGANRAAAFLENFVEENIKWAHMDIAGPGTFFQDKFAQTGGFGGFGAKIVVNFAKSLSQ